MAPALDAPRVLFALAAAGLLGAMLVVPPVNDGDAGEYFLMTESLARHGTPDLRPADVASVARLDRAMGFELNYAGALRGYYDDPRGTWYCYHFWGYPLLAVPARGLLALFRLNGLRAPQLTNAVLLLVALHQVLFRLPFSSRRRLLLFLLLLLSPAIAFVRWAHTEVLSFAGVTMALAWLYAGRTRAPILAAAVAAMQNPPLAFLVAFLWARGVFRAWRQPREWLLCSLAALPALLPPAFYLWRFGTPSLVARESVSLEMLSLHRAVELLLDPNIGLLPYFTLPVLLFLVAVPLAILRPRVASRELALVAVLAPVVLACTVSQNWNHGTIGPSRYAVWMVPFVVFVAATLPDLLGARWARAHRPVAVAAVALQAAIVIVRGGTLARPDYLQHSWPARFLLRHAPSLYNPSPEIFSIRTARSVLPGPGPIVYQDDRGCRKALVWPDQGDALRRLCGRIPVGHERFLSGEEGTWNWRYIDYE